MPTYEYTAGSPIVRDRLWFFTAGRFQNQEQALQTRTTNLPYVRSDDTKRYEGKLTYSPVSGHTVKGSFSKIDEVITNDTQFNVMDLNSLYTDKVPQDLLSLNYTVTVFKNGGGIDLTTIDQSVLTRTNSPALQTFNPFTTTPVQGTNWALGPNFGRALSRMASTVPRTLRVTFGVRF